MTLSIISPVFNSSNTICALPNEIKKALVAFNNDFEIILVDDGSVDNSWQVISEVCSQYPNVKAIKLTENYGQHQAILAGLEHAQGNWIVVMDCDLQDNPAEIPKLYHQTLNDYKIILAKRMNRKDAFIKKWSSFIFWKLIAFFTQTPIHPLVGNFGMYHKDVIAQFIASKDIEPYFSIAMQKFNFSRTYVDVKHQQRLNEKSSYSISKLLKHAANILTHSHKSLLEKHSASIHIIHYSIEKKMNIG